MYYKARQPIQSSHSYHEPPAREIGQPLPVYLTVNKLYLYLYLSCLDDQDDQRHRMTCIAHLGYASRETYNALFTLLSTICHQAHIYQSGTPLLG